MADLVTVKRSYRLEAFGSPLAATTEQLPVPARREVLLRTLACGVCHSDLHLADGYFDLGNAARIDLARSVALPRTLGHEIVGEVVALGPDADGVALGDRRVVFPWIGCGTCDFCRAGSEHLCSAPRALGVNRDGGFADHVLVDDARYLFDFAPLPQEQACTLACSGLTAFSALRKAAPFPAGRHALVIGAGGVGLSAVRLADALLGTAPIVAEPDRTKWALAIEAGAAATIDPREPGTARELVRATGGGVAAAFDFVGSGDSFAFGFSALAKGGRLVVGLMGGATQFSPALLPMKSVSVSGSYVGSLSEMAELMQLARSGVLPALPVVARRLSDVNDALDDLRGARVRGRVVVTP
jgi:D-arabinose 1-dehydrogenase-like Zn-dependent alcohol dehydrogenase